jgi:glycosyltransferase involved in cell wall biosynthesis
MRLSSEEINKRIRDSYEVKNSVLKVCPNPLVSVRTSTYQHASYIKQCIEGVLMQKTNFPFEFIIGEDLSTDGTREIVLEYANKYPDTLRVLTADYNVGPQANGRRCFMASRGKYIALCEGDDFWIDPLKLQKQVDILEENEEFGMCYTQAKVFVQEKKKYAKKIIGFKIPSKGLVFNNTIPPLTTLNRRNLISKFINEREKNNQKWEIGDYYFNLWMEKNSNIFFLKESTSVYRISSNSLSKYYDPNKRMIFLKNSFDLANYFAHKNLNSIDYQEFLSVKYLELYNASIKFNTDHHKKYFFELNNIKNLSLKLKAYLFFTEILRFRKIISLIFKYRSY